MDKPGRGKRFSLKNKLFELMTQMDENVEKYSIVVMRDAAYLRDWKRLSAAAKQKINLCLLYTSEPFYPQAADHGLGKEHGGRL